MEVAAALLVDEKVQWLRQQLPATAATAYFNAGTNGPLPNVVHETLRAAATEELERGRIYPSYYRETHQVHQRLRARIAGIIGADADEVALTRSATEGLNVALMGLEWQRSDEVITTNLEHICLFNVLALLAYRHGVVVRVVDVGHGAGDVAGAIAAAITPRTRAIAISHVQWSSGAIMPIAEIAATARTRGILTIVDAAQAAGQIPVDVHALGVDAYAVSGQKWLCGPGGTGALFVRRDRLADVRPTYIRSGSFDPSGFVVPLPGAARYEMGEHFNPAMRAQEAGLQWLVEEVGLDWLQTRIAALGARCADGLRRIPEVTLTTPRDRMAGLVCFTLDGWHPKALADALHERGLTIRHVEQRPCPTVARVSIGWWNTEAEIDRLVTTVAELAVTPPPEPMISP